MGLVDAGGAALLYAVGWSRAFSSDASRTVAHFVTADSIGDVFRQDRFNNHPLLSFLDHLVYVATGSQDERLLRVLPILFGATAIGMTAAATARRFGTAAGHVAGGTLALNAMTIRHFREVRGYALMTLMAIVATLTLFRLLRQRGDPPLRRRGPLVGTTPMLALYGVALALAIGTHLFAVALIPVHALVLLGSRDLRWRWLTPWALGGGAGLVVQWHAIVDGFSRPPGREFDPTFMARLTANLLGGPWLPGMLVLVVVGGTALRRRPWTPWCVLGSCTMVVAVWATGPSLIDSRFFMWLTPAIAAAAGAAVGRWPPLVFLAAACGAVQLAVLGPDLPKSEVPNRIGAAFVERAQHTGQEACALGRTRASLLAYVDDVRVVWNPPELATCDLAIEAAGPNEQPLVPAACQHFALVLTLPAKHPGALYADRPLAPVPELSAAGTGGAQRWTPTRLAPLCRTP